MSGDHHLHAAGLLKARRDDPSSPWVCAEFSTSCISAEPTYEDAFNSARKKGNEEFALLVYKLENGREIPVWNLTLQDSAAAALSYQNPGPHTLPNQPGSDRSGIRYVDSTSRGYTVATFAETELKVEMVSMTDVTIPFEQAPAARRRAFFSLPAWEAGEEPRLSGPDFTGKPPFPYT